MLRVETHVTELLETGWTLRQSAPDGEELGGGWPASVPGTVAGALAAAGEEIRDLDDFDWWFSCPVRVAPPGDEEEVVLEIGGIATLADIYLGSTHLLSSQSMFAHHAVEIGSALRGGEDVVSIACRSLNRALSVRRPRPRFRGLGVREQRLRYFRTTLLGRGLGGSGLDPVGPYRPVTVVRRRTLAVESSTQIATLVGTRGELRLEAVLRPLGAHVIASASLRVHGPTGQHSVEAEVNELPDGLVRVAAHLAIDDVAPWMPHTHGVPNLYDLEVRVGLGDGNEVRLAGVPVGFRSLSTAGDDFALMVNGVPVFCRGALWTPPDPVSLTASPDQVRQRLLTLRDAGMNMLRVPGTSVWETEIFHRTCDELGLLVWQDLMLARMDYPTDDPEFCVLLTDEVRTELHRLGGHSSTAVVCGGSEVEQQAAMLGLPPEVGRSQFIREELPAIAAEYCPEVLVVPSSPSGGDLPFRVSAGVAHYFGVGAYRRPLTDARVAGVKFASECLAFANVPEQDLLDELARVDPDAAVPGSPAWKRGVPRDAGTSWDFDDVRDHYLGLLYGIEPDELRRIDPETYLDLSRLVSGEVMAGTIAEWRRAGSPCAGALVLEAADAVPGAGWGLLDVRGRGKPVLAQMRRVCRARALWCIDEGLDGIDVHLANDPPEDFACMVRVALYREDGMRIEEATREVTVPGHGSLRLGVEELLGRFVDVGWCYRFGPRGHELVVASAHVDGDPVPLLQHFHRVGPRPLRREPPAALGFDGSAELRDGAIEVLLSAARFAWGVNVRASGWIPDDAWFDLEPGRARRVTLRPTTDEGAPAAVSVYAMNAAGRSNIEVR